MSIMKRCVPALVGAIAGITASLAVSSISAPATSPAASPAAPTAAGALPASVPIQVRVGGTHAALDARVTALEAANGRGAVAPVDAFGSDDDYDIETARANLVAERDRTLAAHDGEPTEPGWAAPASASLEADLETVADAGGFRVASVDCRTTTCVASLDWPSYDDAVLGYTEVARHTYQLDCAQSILLPEPTEHDAAYRAHLVVDCARH